ncbi:MAG TPA: TetR family transcriptional regulator, partial [Rhodopila sp.]|nr:TetR family transcriptional regulator [Rhodopila sp.]
PTALLLHCATHRSMRWMLQGAGVPATGPRGDLQVRGLTAVWYWGLRTWERDETEDLSATMATTDSALHRADRVASWLHGRTPEPPPRHDDVTEPEPPLGDMPLPDVGV